MPNAQAFPTHTKGDVSQAELGSSWWAWTPHLPGAVAWSSRWVLPSGEAVSRRVRKSSLISLSPPSVHHRSRQLSCGNVVPSAHPWHRPGPAGLPASALHTAPHADPAELRSAGRGALLRTRRCSRCLPREIRAAERDPGSCAVLPPRLAALQHAAPFLTIRAFKSTLFIYFF